MTRLVPVREIAHLRLALPPHDRWIDELTWIPASATEIHLASRYYPIAVRMEDQKPRLGLIVGRRYLVHALLDPAGTWRGAYRPVRLRCFPFESADVGDDPLSDISDQRRFRISVGNVRQFHSSTKPGGRAER